MRSYPIKIYCQTMKYKTAILLIIITGISLFLNSYRRDFVPPCLNADEAAFSYNAYSILSTGKDEYGSFLPLRLKSFGDYKLPLYSYLSVPFIGLFGLNETTARAVNILITLLFPITIFWLAKELFNQQRSALLSALLVSVALGLQIVGRHTHEAYLSAYLTILSFCLLIKVLKNNSLTTSIAFLCSIFLLLFSYHPGRVFAAYFLSLIGIHILIHHKKTSYSIKKIILTLFAGIVIIGLFSVTDLIYKPERVKNLLFFNNAGFSLKINELRGEGGSTLLYNKLTIGIKDLTHQYIKYFSPEFLVINGDENNRFGYDGMGPVTPLEYVGILLGAYFLFKKKEKWRYHLLGLLLIAPISGALSWAGMSITRSLTLFAVIPLISGYGIANLFDQLPKKSSLILIPSVMVLELFFLFYSWDFYFNHYPQRAPTIRSWQCGYKELTNYVKTKYQSTDKFYITKKNGEPYIMFLFYLKYPPYRYQKVANLTAPDEYGFGQVERFDKFEFNFRIPKENNTISIGYPDDFANVDAKIMSKIKKIQVGTEDIFWIYEQ